VNRGPIGLGEASVALLLADRGEELLLQRGVGHLGRQRPAEPSGGKPLQCQPDRRRRDAHPAGDLVDCHPGHLQTKHVAHLAHRGPLCWHRPLPWQAKGADAKRASRDAVRPVTIRATSSRNSGRNHLGTPSEIKSEWRARSLRIRGRLPPESACCGQRVISSGRASVEIVSGIGPHIELAHLVEQS
jgi:hypothetical protein